VREIVTPPRCRVSGLRAETKYEFRVTARNEYGDAPPSKPVSATTDKSTARDDAPRQVAGLRLKEAPKLGSVALIWSDVVTATAGYKLRQRLHDADDRCQVETAASPGTVRLIEGVAHGVRYDFQVAGANASGDGVWSSVLTVRTLRRPQWADLIIKMDGTDEIDVTRVQMLFFTVVSALFVGMKIVTSYTIPDIPQGFLLLMGISNGIYLTAKFIPD
jgi:hypothetical protein